MIPPIRVVIPAQAGISPSKEMSSHHSTPPGEANSRSMSVEFWLKPYLHSLLVDLCGKKGFEITAHNAVGCMALACLTPKPAYADQTTASFQQGRMRIVGIVPLRTVKDHGFHIHRASHFEDLVEHLFYHMLMVYIDAKTDDGITQNEAIRMFLDRHNIGLGDMDEASLKKSVIRRRKKMRHH